MALMKVFSGSEILAIALKERLAEAGVETNNALNKVNTIKADEIPRFIKPFSTH